jgi:hypothetical protein
MHMNIGNNERMHGSASVQHNSASEPHLSGTVEPSQLRLQSLLKPWYASGSIGWLVQTSGL